MRRNQVAVALAAMIMAAGLGCGGLELPDPAGSTIEDETEADALDGKEDGVKPKKRVVKESKNGKTVTARVGDTIDVRLAGNPTTGYEWQLLSSSKSLPLSSSKYTPSKSQLVGSGGTYDFLFNVDELAAGGSHAIELAYFRSWEGPEAAIDSFSVTIKVLQSPAQEGEVCGAGFSGETVASRACDAGLVCCYPCGIGGCKNVCMKPCTGTQACAGGCPMFP